MDSIETSCLDLLEHEQVADDAEHQHARQSSEQGAPATLQADPTDDGRGHHREDEILAVVGGNAAETADLA